MLTLRAHDAGFKLTSSAHRRRAPTPTSPGANWLWRPLPPDSRLERSRSLCRLAPVPTGLEISGLFADWPQCPLAWRPRAAPGHDRAWFHPRCSLGLDTSRRKSTRPNWDTWLEVIWGYPPPAAPSMGRRQNTRVTRIRVGPLCRLASVPTGLDGVHSGLGEGSAW